MFIGIKQRLEDIYQDRKDNIPEIESLTKGTLVVIDGPLDFTKTDGYIQFMKIALDNIKAAYGTQTEKWQRYINRLYISAEKLQDSNTRFSGNTIEEFREYCETLSHVMERDTKEKLEVIHLDIMTGDDLVPFLEKHVSAGNTRGFYYGQTEDAKNGLMQDLMHQLSQIKFEKTSRERIISNFLTSSGYHEHVHDALNIIMSVAVYAINCSSTKKNDAYSFDTQTIHNQLKLAEIIMERVEHLV